MRNHVVAGWLLRRFMSRDRAEAVLGDLLEAANDNPVEFRKLLFVSLCSLGRLGAAGFIAASVLGGAALCVLQMLFFGSAHIDAADATIHAWGSSLALATGFVWILAVFSLVRYGLRDAMARLAVCLASLGSIAIAFWWIPIITHTCLALSLSLAVMSVCRSRSRPAFTALSLLTVIQFFLWFGGLTAMVTPFALVLKHARVDLAVAKLLLFAWLAVAYPVLMGVACFACTRVRRWAAI
jgi:hypothetical protein